MPTATTEKPAEQLPRKTKKRPTGRPPTIVAADTRVEKQNEFYAIVGKVPAEDWGPRASIYLYRLEPYTDRRTSGTPVNLMRYDEPVDENRVMHDFGSGKYRFMLTFRKAAADRGDMIARHEFEINNPMFPPRIAPGEWVDDPRNTKWAWAKPHVMGQQNNGQNGNAPPQQQSSLVEAVQVMTAVQKAADERANNKPAAAPQADPIDSAVKILQLTKGGGETILMQMFQEQLRHSNDRNERLEKELREQRNIPAAAAIPTDPLAQLESLAGKVDTLKKLGLFGGTTDSALTRSKMGPWMEFLQPGVTHLAEAASSLAKTLGPALAQGMIMRQRQQALTQQPGSQQSRTVVTPTMPATDIGTANTTEQAQRIEATPEQQMMDFIGQITPPMLNHLYNGVGGDGFAAFIADGWGVERLQQMQTPPSEAILEFYKTTPYWAQIEPRQQQFTKFLEEFRTWKPEEDGDDNEGEEEGEADAV